MPDETVYLSHGMEKDDDATKRHALGTRGVLPDGKIFRYALNGATALEAGRLLQSPAQINDGDWDMDLPVESTHGEGGSTIGSRRIPILASSALTSALAADAFQDGWLAVNDGPGEGHVYRISSHPAYSTGDTVGTVLVVDLAYDDEIVSTNMSTASLVGLIQSPYLDVIEYGFAAAAAQIVGVACSSVAASRYFWAQTWGPASLLVDVATLSVGRNVVPTQSTAGAAGGSVETIERLATALPVESTVGGAIGRSHEVPVVGYAIAVGAAAGDYGMIFLTLAP